MARKIEGWAPLVWIRNMAAWRMHFAEMIIIILVPLSFVLFCGGLICDKFSVDPVSMCDRLVTSDPIWPFNWFMSLLSTALLKSIFSFLPVRVLELFDDCVISVLFEILSTTPSWWWSLSGCFETVSALLI